MRRTGTLVLLLVVSLPLFAAKQRAVQHPAASAPGTGPTFSKEIVRIFQQRCQTCHHEGDIAPFPLITYADARPRAALIKFMTETRQMPPWKAEQGCGEFKDERRLSDAEIATIGAWVDAGAPEGDRSQLPAPLSFDSGWELGQPDMIFASAEPYTPPAGTDTYRCFTIPSNLIATGYVRAFDVHPGDRSSVHHVIAYLDTTGASVALDENDPGPGYTCFGGPGFAAPGTIGAWAPGSRALELDERIGLELPAASRVVLQIHYHPHGDEEMADRTEFAVYFATRTDIKPLRFIPVANTTFTIPPNDADYRVDAEWPVPTPVNLKLWIIAPHMHLLGRSMKVEMTPPGGSPQCLVDIENWDFNWQTGYRYRTPIDIPVGSRVSLTARFDNSSANPRNPSSPPKAVSWGEATTDEMCLAFLGVTVE